MPCHLHPTCVRGMGVTPGGRKSVFSPTTPPTARQGRRSRRGRSRGARGLGPPVVEGTSPSFCSNYWCPCRLLYKNLVGSESVHEKEEEKGQCLDLLFFLSLFFFLPVVSLFPSERFPGPSLPSPTPGWALHDPSGEVTRRGGKVRGPRRLRPSGNR